MKAEWLVCSKNEFPNPTRKKKGGGGGKILPHIYSLKHNLISCRTSNSGHQLFSAGVNQQLSTTAQLSCAAELFTELTVLTYKREDIVMGFIIGGWNGRGSEGDYVFEVSWWLSLFVLQVVCIAIPLLEEFTSIFQQQQIF